MQAHHTLIFFLLCLSTHQQANGTGHGEGTTTTMSLEGCKGREYSIINAVNASTGFNSTQIIVNCLAYSDNVTISTGSISYRVVSGSSGRYIVNCINGLLVLQISSQSFSDVTSSCYQCEDAPNPCIAGTECASGCRFCYNRNQSNCVHCEQARYNDTCMDQCPTNRTSNPHNGNQCECPGNHIGENCNECELECPNTYLLHENNCTCAVCPDGYYQQLVNDRSRVPDSVVGSPGLEESSEHHRKKRAAEDHNDDDDEEELTMCVQMCPNGSKPDDNGICYACGISYCLNCTEENSCIECREGTLFNKTDKTNETSPYHCAGFYSVIRELAHELDVEEEHEIEKLAQEQLELKIILPIACFLTIVVFVFFGVVAHFRYPHVGHQKRHRDPKKKQSEEAIEKRFRPQSTVRYR